MEVMPGEDDGGCQRDTSCCDEGCCTVGGDEGAWECHPCASASEMD